MPAAGSAHAAPGCAAAPRSPRRSHAAASPPSARRSRLTAATGPHPEGRAVLSGQQGHTQGPHMSHPTFRCLNSSSVAMMAVLITAELATLAGVRSAAGQDPDPTILCQVAPLPPPCSLHPKGALEMLSADPLKGPSEQVLGYPWLASSLPINSQGRLRRGGEPQAGCVPGRWPQLGPRPAHSSSSAQATLCAPQGRGRPHCAIKGG